MNDFLVVKHAQGAPGLRLAGLGPNLIPQRALNKLIKLFDNNTSWAKGRSKKEVKIMLSHSKVIVSLWNKNKLIGFGRATTDESFRAVLWDIVIDHNYQKRGLGKLVVNSLLTNNKQWGCIVNKEINIKKEAQTKKNINFLHPRASREPKKQNKKTI